MDLSNQELHRYSRHLNLPDFDLTHQLMLKQAKVLVVGAGGLGSPMIQYLAAAGVGTIGLVDYDVVDLSNLQRQVLYSTDDVGQPKTQVATKKINDLNPHVRVISFNEPINASNALEIIKDFDIVADGTDNFPTRYLINDACVLLDKVNVHASVFRFEGQVSVFNYLRTDGKRGPNYRDLFPSPPPPDQVTSCAEGGILGVLPGIMGNFQALEVIKVILGIGEVLSGKLMVIDTLTMNNRVLKFSKNPKNPISGDQPSIKELIDYEEFCGLKKEEITSESSIDVATLKEWQEQFPESIQLIDVRESHEYQLGNISGLSLPLSNIEMLTDQISRDKKVIIHCKSGARSRKAIKLLSGKYDFKNLINLEGGILAWKALYEPDLLV